MHVSTQLSKQVRDYRVSETGNGLLTPKQFMQTSSSPSLKVSSKKGTKAHEWKVGYHQLETGKGFLLHSQTQKKQLLTNKKNNTSMTSKTPPKVRQRMGTKLILL